MSATEEDLGSLAEELGLELQADLSQARIPELFLERVPLKVARENSFAAIGIESPEPWPEPWPEQGPEQGPSDDLGVVRVATAAPQEIQALDRLSHILDAEIRPVVAPRDEIRRLIDAAYHEHAAGVGHVADALDVVAGDLTLGIDGQEDILDLDHSGPIVKLVNSMFLQAVKMRASDIHIQPHEDAVGVRYRIDGVLYKITNLNRDLLEGLVSRIKVLAGMDIAERRVPQDGGHVIRIGEREIDLRISSLPTRFGERITIRLQDKSSGIFQINQLGMAPEDLARFKQLISFSHGIIFVTGPTGSGKTTTLYAALSHINTPDKNIIALEDPVEYHLDGISQTEVAPKKGLTFARGLRSIVRQDPDIIMVGEVRDLETARIAIQAALTGHLVFSTLHTNDASSAVTRLLDIGVEPYLVASSLNAAVAQRLVRTVCPDCRDDYLPSPEERGIIEQAGIPIAPDHRLARSRGCDACFQTGYRGRTAIYEILVVTDAIRELIVRRASSAELQRQALADGFANLRHDGLRKVMQGVTSLVEVNRVTQMDAL